MSKFIKFLGNAALAGKQVAVYQEDDGYTLKAETVGGNAVHYMKTDENGKKVWRTMNPLNLTSVDYEAFCERVSAGILGNQDVRIVHRALIEMGYPEESE